MAKCRSVVNLTLVFSFYPYFHSVVNDDVTLSLKNKEFGPTPTLDIISYRMRRSKRLIVQGTGNGCGDMTVQKNQNKRKNNLFSVCIFGHPLSVRPAYKFQKRNRKRGKHR